MNFLRLSLVMLAWKRATQVGSEEPEPYIEIVKTQTSNRGGGR